jgi:hypothetical protein
MSSKDAEKPSPGRRVLVWPTAGIDFFDHYQAHEAIAVCRRCPVLAGCRNAATSAPPVGVVQAGLLWPTMIHEAARVAAAMRRETDTYGGLLVWPTYADLPAGG